MDCFDSTMLKIAKKENSVFGMGGKAIVFFVFMQFVDAFFIAIAINFLGFNLDLVWVVVIMALSCFLTDIKPRVARKWCDFRGISWKKEAGEDAGKTADKGEQV